MFLYQDASGCVWFSTSGSNKDGTTFLSGGASLSSLRVTDETFSSRFAGCVSDWLRNPTTSE